MKQYVAIRDTVSSVCTEANSWAYIRHPQLYYESCVLTLALNVYINRNI